MTISEQVRKHPWFIVQNGNQLDIHVRVVPNTENPRELTVASNVREDCAEWIVIAHNEAKWPK